MGNTVKIKDRRSFADILKTIDIQDLGRSKTFDGLTLDEICLLVTTYTRALTDTGFTLSESCRILSWAKFHSKHSKTCDISLDKLKYFVDNL